MSAAFKNAKKKANQEQLRKLMKEHQKITKEVKKIDSPLAKYNDQGQLTCALCKSIVRSEAVWTVHINAKQHKLNVELAKKLKEQTNNFTTPLKRPLTPPLPEVPEKKIKGILKNAPQKPPDTRNLQVADTSTDMNVKNGALPSDFFDSSNKPTSRRKEKDILKPATLKEELEGKKGNSEENRIENEPTDVLPEGFFDDPKLDAKARNQEYKDPVEEEWEKFLKEIKDADNQSAAIIAEDQEEATTERQIDEIDEQLKKLNKVLDLEKKKEEIATVLNEVKHESTEDHEEEDDIDFDEFLDWRAKNSFK